MMREIEEHTHRSHMKVHLLGWNGALLTDSVKAIDDQVGDGYGYHRILR
ncbi:MAG: hypothetical protein Ct9H300mP15_06320 [Gemmatimonadota bacterium]|nr:MAG: hypothetical protein Ct9H300mP15_06320 [Gemmatimonadota bacterium]